MTLSTEKAASLIESLCDRLEPSADGLRYMLAGPISRGEHDALRLALTVMLKADGGEAPGLSDRPHAPASPQAVKVALVLDSVSHAPSDDHIACLDFGTAYSKAGIRDLSASASDGFFDLPLGQLAGEDEFVYPVSSSLFFDRERILFGPNAVSQSLLSELPRLDSIKRYVSEMVGQVGEKQIPATINRSGLQFTIRDGVLLYLAYLTDLLGDALEANDLSRYAARRYTLPGLDSRSPKQAEAVKTLMQRLLAEAQVLADTFHGRWAGGIPLAEARDACTHVAKLSDKEIPTQLIREGLAEALAASQSAIERTSRRALMLVVDIGAGTTDVGAFFVQPGAGTTVVAPKANSMRVLRQAGDRADEALVALILKKSGASSGSQTYEIIESDLKLKVRQLKQQLFSDLGEAIVVPLANDDSIEVAPEELERHPWIVAYVSELRKIMSEALGTLTSEELGALGGRCRVVLTGGGSRLPTIRSACSGSLKVGDGAVDLTIVDARPEWLATQDPNFVDVFDQMAVAAGGCEEPEALARVAKAVSDYGGAKAPQYVIAPTYKS